MIKFLKTIYWRCRLHICSVKYKEYCTELKNLEWLRYSDGIQYSSDVHYISEKHKYYLKQVRHCNEKLQFLASP